jgi:hypothetical protein
MRLASLSCLLLLLTGITVAQSTDTSFSAGPQYLITSDSPLLLRPIATPSLSFEAPLASTPMVSTVPDVAVPAFTVPPELQNQADLFPIYYGVERISVIELSGVEPPRNLPESFVDVGVLTTVHVPEPQERGYGVTLGDAAAFWKTHKTSASHVYTNADVARLHGG